MKSAADWILWAMLYSLIGSVIGSPFVWVGGNENSRIITMLFFAFFWPILFPAALLLCYIEYRKLGSN